jgi:hypothetical protein
MNDINDIDINKNYVIILFIKIYNFTTIKIENYTRQEYKINTEDPHITTSLIECMVSSNLFKNAEIAKNDLSEEINKWEKYFIAIEHWNVIGFVSWGARNLHSRRWEYELFHIGTIKKWIAKALFNHLVEEAKDYYKNLSLYLRKLYLFTSKENQNAHWFYTHIWMNITGFSIDKFWSDKIEIEYSLIFNQYWEKTNISLNITKDDLFKIL